ncbi:ATP-dependent DNA helicase RecG [Corynebacterium liangguodongii]|uniref:ATP-dependent DNA helicase RecG n=1 Tax=Corynebacterium liangguodongii TaxID=2079535 RepID=A0A2S0WDP8_9CORY|nr:ATP-dependent DNA helicase RecG [Corynebacterium liangguodongii]AWB83905.1 ATP-dependent DNA helicase RecG [Corynebacterium liangguodongii]PWB99044.1 ATP-dependent DNA helicase RecG [Corynebacterium liangguodongii]
MLGNVDTRPLNLVVPLKQARALHRHLGMETCGDLLRHYPRKYLHYGSGGALEGTSEGDTISVIGDIVSARSNPKAAKPMHIITVFDGTATIEATFFGSRYAAGVLTEGRRVMLTGKLGYYRGAPQLKHPDFVLLDGSAEATGALRQLAHFGKIDDILAGREWLPMYPATSKVSTWTIMGAVHAVLSTLPRIEEPLGATPIGFCSLDLAIRGVHAPPPEGPGRALARLKYEEASGVALVMAVRRAEQAQRVTTALPHVRGGDMDTLLNRLPYTLTDGQSLVLGEISADLSRPRPMSRLLQGEVGSGKTIVSLVAMLQAIDNGAQCALLAPTEVLVAQHARSLQETTMRAGLPTRIVALTGSMSAGRRQEALLSIVSGEADIVVGTHALLQEAVEFFRLGLVIVDEQHRFGVEQRDALRAKSPDAPPHMLVMTATPIPRTMAITVFGDLEISTLKELPGGRKPIQSSLVPEFKPRWVARAWEKIREEAAAGRQAYIVCPRIDGPGGVTETAEALADTEFEDLSVGVLHGRLPAEEKDAVMADFSAGGIDVLVSTTVIEVGVDVPNATVMMVRESEHFGVSQLHQLRGRVGRGGNASLCLFHTRAEPGTPAFERVSQVAATSDGFELAELDLKARQEGDILGAAQSGNRRTLRLINLVADYDIVRRAYDDAEEFVARFPAQAADAARELVTTVPEEWEYLDKT